MPCCWTAPDTVVARITVALTVVDHKQIDSVIFKFRFYSGDRALINPITGVGCCARAPSGWTAAKPPIIFMKSRRRTESSLRKRATPDFGSKHIRLVAAMGKSSQSFHSNVFGDHFWRVSASQIRVKIPDCCRLGFKLSFEPLEAREAFLRLAYRSSTEELSSQFLRR
jgi:hypothetical protein